jgi:hypothetical protein
MGTVNGILPSEEHLIPVVPAAPLGFASCLRLHAPASMNGFIRGAPYGVAARRAIGGAADGHRCAVPGVTEREMGSCGSQHAGLVSGRHRSTLDARASERFFAHR